MENRAFTDTMRNHPGFPMTDVLVRGENTEAQERNYVMRAKTGSAGHSPGMPRSTAAATQSRHRCSLRASGRKPPW